MAFKKIGGLSQALKMGNKKGETKQCEGFLLAVKKNTMTFGKGKNKDERESYRYEFVSKKGGKFSVWGGGVINNVLLGDNGKLVREYVNKLIRLTFKGYLPKKPGQNAGRNIEVEIDDDQKMPKGIGRIQF